MKTFFDEGLYKLEEEFRRARDKFVSALRQKSSPIQTSYQFEDHSGNTVVLNDLFGMQRDLIVVHNMGRSCAYCTLWADGINGLLHHIESRTAIVLVNPDPIEVQKEFAASRNWKFKMLRDAAGTFTDEMGFAEYKDGKRYVQPGFSTFYKNDDETITRVGADGFGPGDVYMPVFPMFELLKDQDAGWHPKYSYDKPIQLVP